jgi:hypothetical protein
MVLIIPYRFTKYLIGAIINASLLLLIAMIVRLTEPHPLSLALIQLALSLSCVIAFAVFILVGLYHLLKKRWQFSLQLVIGATVQIVAFILAQGFINPLAE